MNTKKKGTAFSMDLAIWIFLGVVLALVIVAVSVLIVGKLT